MSRRCSAVLLLLSCGPSTGGTVAGTDTDATSENGTTADTKDATTGDPTPTTGDPTTGDPTTGEHIPVACDSVVMDHAEACPGEPCAIVVDVAVRCQDGEFAAPGLRVAAAPEATWMVTASSTDAMLFKAAADGAARVDALPARFARETILLATAPAGDLHVISQVAVDVDQFINGLAYLSEANGWTEELVYSTGKGVPVLDLDVQADGVPHMWFIGDAPDQYNEATPDGQGGWTITDVVPPKSTDWQHFTRATDGRTIAAGFRQASNQDAWSLFTRSEGVELKIGNTVFATYPFYYVLAPSPTPEAAPGPQFAAAIQHDHSIRVAWPVGPDDSSELSIPGTGMLDRECFGDWNDGCPEPCTESSVGLEEQALGFARTSDGAGWLVYVETHLDQTFSYTEDCEREQGFCYCQPQRDEDNSFAMMHVVKVPLDGSPPVDVLAQTVDPLALDDLYFGFSDTPRAVDVRAFGDALAIGLRTRDPIDATVSVRVMRIDLTALP